LGRFAALPRKVLVIAQFSISVVLIIGTVIVYRQIQFAKNRPVGYQRDGLVTLNLITPGIQQHFDAFREELIQSGVIASVAGSGSPTTGVWNSTSGFSWPGKDPNLSTDFAVMTTGLDYGKTIRWKIKEGRDFSREFLTDTSSLILNDAAVRFMHLKDPVGQTVTWWGQSYKVIGVLENMVIEYPYLDARPVIYPLSLNDFNTVIIRVKSDKSMKEALSKIEPVFKKFNPDQPFDYKFVDEERSREIGLRKVLGASVMGLWILLLRDFVMLVIIACFISIPVAQLILHQWLMNYAYHTQISWWIFVASGAGALLVTLLTVSYQALKAAFANPVKTLRAE
jgi:putative ABC transport system permease protein